MYNKWRSAVGLLGLFRVQGAAPGSHPAGSSTALRISDKLRDISEADSFSVFDNEHTEEAGRVIDDLMDAPSTADFVSMCKELQREVNDEIYVYCIAVASYHRKDTKHFRLPPVYQTHAREFIREKLLKESLSEELEADEAEGEVPTREKHAKDVHPGIPTGPKVARVGGDGTEIADDAIGVKPEAERVQEPEVVDEEVLDYFREDVCLNSHHWHWHLVYPHRGIRGVTLDRRGELFFYMHRQMLARYDAERLSNGIAPVIAFTEWDKPIPEGYDPDIARGRVRYPPRPPGSSLADDHVQKLKDLKKEVKFDKRTDLNELGKQVESGVHNTGHRHLAALSTPGVMSYTKTAIRDPIFFRWHKFIDDLIGEYKSLLDPYPETAFTWPEVTLNKVQVLNEAGKATPTLKTFKREQKIDMSYSLDFRVTVRRGREVTVTHIDHHEFSYELDVTNNTDLPQWATVRLFMVPKQSERGIDYLVKDFNTKCIEMDRFTEKVPPGDHSIVRKSSDSSVVIPWEQSFDILYENVGKETDSQKTTENYCGCGWPEHLQIPRGNSRGLPVYVVAMVTDWDKDKVRASRTEPAALPDLTLLADPEIGEPREEKSCKNAASYCGLRDRLYPDKQAMGFPFDRPLKPETLEEFISGKDNMKFASIEIVHEDRFVD